VSGNPDQPLAGRGIVITRPAHQAAHLAKLVRNLGGRPILFPVLEILDATDLGPLNALIDGLDQFDMAIFISPNAVRKAMNLVRARRELPATLKIASIGRGTTKELKSFGVRNVIAPETRFDSENLLALPDLQDVAGSRIVIFRGDGGRELLGDTLLQRGAQITYAECYRRARPDISAATLLKHWARNELDAITVTSSEGVHNLYDMVGKLAQHWLKQTPLFVPHERIAEVARGLGLQQVIVTKSGDEGLAQGLAVWFSQQG
jgi:uroporphyrinogen-III synthase